MTAHASPPVGSFEPVTAAARDAWRSKRLWLLAWMYPLAQFWLVLPGHTSDDDPLGYLVEHWAMLGNLEQVGDEDDLVALVLFGSLYLILQARVGLGLVAAAQSGPGERDRFRLRHVWRAGRDLTWSAAGLVLARQAIGLVALTLVLAPPFGLGQALMYEASDVAYTLAFPLLCAVYLLGLGYAFALDACCQLGLQSCLANRRGAGSAFQHGWRLLAHDPARSARIVATWAGLHVAWSLVFLSGLAFVVDDVEAGAFLWLLSLPFAGTFAAFFWQRSYVELGGMRTVPLVPPEALELHPTA